MLAPAAFWGGAVPSAAQTAGMETGRAYDAATPSAIESIGIGLLMNRHTRGLQSGGMVGYSTFFTGYDADRHGLGRKISLGRLGAQAVSASARGLMHTPLANSDRAASVLRPLTMAHKYGVGGAVDAAMRGPIGSDDVLQPKAKVSLGAAGGVGGKSMPASPDVGPNRTVAPSHLRDFVGDEFDVPRSNRSRAASPKARVPYRSLDPSDVDDVVGVGRSASAAADVGEDVSDVWRYTVGWLGGEGFTAGGTRASARETVERIDGSAFRFFAAESGSQGARVLGGPAGRALGAAFRIGAGYEIARLAVDAGTYAAGEAYESMVETTSAIRERVGSDQSMSPAYYNRGAATERQRARRSLNLRSLNPRTQLMGNEASMAHG